MTGAAAVAAWGLPTAHRLPATALPDDAFDALLAACTNERVLGLLGGAVRAGAIALTEAQREQVETRWQEWNAHALRVEHLVVHLHAVLTGAGIPVRVLKGVALAHLAYPAPELRTYGDVDLLVPSEQFSAAARIVADACGGRRAQPELRPGFDDRFGREILVRVGEVEVDLHRTLVDGAYGLTVALPDLWADPAQFTLGATRLHGLGPAARLLHAAYAAVCSDWPPRLVALRDLAQMIATGGPDADTAVATAERWRATAVLAAGVRTAWRTLRATERPALVAWADEHRFTPRDRLLLAAYRGAARGYTSQAASLVVLPGVRDRVAYARAIAFPSREYREARHLGRLGLFGAGARRARHT